MGVDRPRGALKRRFSDARERSAAALLAAADSLLDSREVPFRALAAFLVGASYFLVFHATHNRTTFCGLDLCTKAGRNEIERAMAWLVALTSSPAA